MKKILLTGITGFLGSNIASKLIDEGYEVHGIVRKSSSLDRINQILNSVSLHYVEETNFDVLFCKFEKDFSIIHTATNYGRNNESVSEIFYANTVFPLRLLDSGVRAGASLFINTDTILDKYLNLYSFSKNQLMQWGQYFAIHENISFINLRLEHIYGGNDDRSKFTSFVMNACLNNVEEINLTPGDQCRDFIHVDDVAEAYLTLLKNKLPRGFNEYDVGSGESISIKEFASMVKEITKSKTKLNFGAIPYREGEVMHSVANTKDLLKLGWTCRFNIQAGLMKVLKSGDHL